MCFLNIFSSFIGFPKNSAMTGKRETHIWKNLNTKITKVHFQKNVEMKCYGDLKEKDIEVTACRLETLLEPSLLL